MAELSPIYKKSESKELQRFFNTAPWEIAFTGSVFHDASPATLERYFRAWRSQAAQRTGLQVAAMGIANTRRGEPRHVHALLLGRNSKDQTLQDVNPYLLQSLEITWAMITDGTSKIEQIQDLGWARYMVLENLLYNPMAQFITPINVPLIKQLSV